MFIAFEGIEGAGKSTQVARLAERLRAAGRDVLVVREPGGTPFAEQVRQLLLHEPYEVTPASEMFLFQAARSDLVTRVIRPALAAGRIVIADRYELSTRAYQVAGRGLDDARVRAAIALATGGLEPDLYLVLDITVDVGRARQAEQGKSPDRMERADAAFHARVAEAFRTAAGANVRHLPADGSAGRTAELVWAAVAAKLPA